MGAWVNPIQDPFELFSSQNVMGIFSYRKAQVDFRPVSWIPGRTRAAPGLAAHSQRGARVLVVPVPASSGVSTLRWVDSLWQLETNETTKSELLSAVFLSWTGSIGHTGSKGVHGTLLLGRSWRGGDGKSQAGCASCCTSATVPPCPGPREQAGTKRDVFYQSASQSPRKWTVFLQRPSTIGLDLMPSPLRLTCLWQASLHI